jgi:hypothetical protein
MLFNSDRVDDEQIIQTAKAVLEQSPNGLGNVALARRILQSLQKSKSISNYDEANDVERLRQKLYTVLPRSGLFEHPQGHIRQKSKFGTTYPKGSAVWIVKSEMVRTLAL